jgi:Na+/melibiose symporter-like transporter
VSLGRPFSVLWSANALSNLSDGLAFVTMPLFAAALTDDPRWVAGLATVYAVVRLVVALPVGVYVDRLDRRSLIVAANILRGLALLGLAVAVQLGAASLVVLYAVMAVVGTLESFADNATVAMLPSLVRRANLDKANARVSSAQLVADEFVGPPLGGLLFAVAVAAPVYAMGGLWAAAGIIALALPRTPNRSEPPGDVTIRRHASIYREAREGVVWLSRHRIVGSLALIGGLASIGYMLPFSVLVLFARDRLGLNGLGYGALLAFSALGGLLGTFVAPAARARFGYRWTTTASLAIGAISLAGLYLAREPILAGVMLALYIFHAIVWGICATSLRQRLIPGAILGRVGAASRVLGLIGLVVGSALGGVLAVSDIAAPTLAGALVFAICALIAFWALPKSATLDDHAAADD